MSEKCQLRTIAAQQEVCESTAGRCALGHSVKKNEVIIELGAEGGSITLSGVWTERGWSFAREVTDWTPELIGEERIQKRSAVVETWEAALKLLDEYPWPNLSPISIHPDFRQKIWVAVQERLHSATGPSRSELKHWREFCGVR
jgi:hypothetical protein